jgi:hypothetical protein
MARLTQTIAILDGEAPYCQGGNCTLELYVCGKNNDDLQGIKPTSNMIDVQARGCANIFCAGICDSYEIRRGPLVQEAILS